MKLPKFEKNATVVLDSYQRNPFFYELLKDVSGITHLETTSLNRLYNLDFEDDLELIVLFFKTLNDPHLKLNIFHNYRNSLNFVLELITLYKIINTHKINLTALPKSNQKEQEVYFIMEEVFQVKTNFQNKIMMPLQKDFLYQIEGFERELWELPLLQKIDAKPISIINQKDIHLKAFKTLNNRLEIEAVAQQIIDLKLPLNETMIICLSDSYYPIIKQVFQRYNLPFYLNDLDDKFQFIEQFINLFSLWEKPTTNSLLKCLEANCWNLKDPFSLISLLEYYQVDFDALLNFVPDQDLSTLKYHYLEKNNLESLINKTQADLANLKHAVAKILEIKDLKDALNHFYSLVYQNISIGEKDNLIKLKTNLENYYPHLNSLKEKTELLKYLLQRIRPTNHDSYLNQIIVSNQKKFFYPNLKHCFIVGGLNTNYPNVYKYNGIIDETYLAKLPLLPLSERTERYLNSLEKIFAIAPNIYLSFPYADFQGKPLILAAEFEDLAKKHQTTFLEYKVLENDILPDKDYQINPELLWSLISKDNTIYGSVSSFEDYTTNNYHYFLKHALKLKEYQLPNFNSANLGTITHDLIEILIHKYQKEYTKVSFEDLQEIVSSLFQQYQIHSQLSQKEGELIKLRYLRQLTSWLRFLDEYEASNSFMPALVEKPFEAELIIDDVKLILKGRIDRIDISDTYFQIIDFKSSKRELKDAEIAQGLQLQLLTYLYFYSKETDLKPFGAYYSFLPTGYINQINASINFRPNLAKIEITNPLLEHDAFVKQLQLPGKTFGNPATLFSNSKYVKDLKGTDNITSSQKLDFNKVETFIKEVYQAIILKLKAGEIDCYPVKGGCQFCPYKNICQYQGDDDKQEMLTSSIDFKEEVKDAK